MYTFIMKIFVARYLVFAYIPSYGMSWLIYMVAAASYSSPLTIIVSLFQIDIACLFRGTRSTTMLIVDSLLGACILLCFLS